MAAALGDLIYRGASVWKRLVGNTTATKQFLTQTGGGSPAASDAPAWGDVTDADLVTSDVTTNDVSITKHGFVPKAPDDATQYLDGTGAWSVPAGGGGGGGGGGAVVLLASLTASSSTSLDFTTRNAPGQSGAIFQSDYDEYLIEVVNAVPATAGANLIARVSTDGGSTYDSGTNYRWAYHYTGSGGAGPTRVVSETGTSYFLGGALSNTAASAGLFGRFRLANPLSATQHKLFGGDCVFPSNDAHWYIVATGGSYASTTATNALQFLMSSGNLASGTVRLYGVAKSPGGAVQTAEVAISSAEILALRATPKTLVAAPGEGLLYEFVSMTLLLDATATAYVESAANLAVKYTDGSGAQVSETIEATGFIDQTADTMTTARAKLDAIVAKTGCENKALVLHNIGAGEFTTGTGTMRVKVSYRTWTTGW